MCNLGYLKLATHYKCYSLFPMKVIDSTKTVHVTQHFIKKSFKKYILSIEMDKYQTIQINSLF